MGKAVKIGHRRRGSWRVLPRMRQEKRFRKKRSVVSGRERHRRGKENTNAVGARTREVGWEIHWLGVGGRTVASLWGASLQGTWAQ